MKKLLISIILVIVVVAGGAYLYMQYGKAPTGISFQCGSLTIAFTQKFLALPKPDKAAELDEYGCHKETQGCICTKTDPQSGAGMVFSAVEASDSSFKIPQDKAGQEAYLHQLAAFMKLAQATTSMKITDAYTPLQNNPTVTLTTTSSTTTGAYTGKDIFFIRNAKIYNVTFQSNSAIFDAYWPEIEKTLGSIKFSR